MPTTSKGLRYPALSAAPNVPQDVQNLASDVDTVYGDLLRRGPHVCTSTTRPSSPATGLTIYETDLRCLRLWDGTGWRRYAFDAQTYASQDAFQAANDTSTSTSYVSGTANGVVFVAPPSGAVMVTVSGNVGSNSTGVAIATYMSFEVRAGGTIGTGTVFLAASDQRAAVNPSKSAAGTGYGPGFVRRMVTGLTPAATYNARSMFRAVSGEAAVQNRNILVEPTP